MAKKQWQIKFCSLRTGTVYTVSVIKSESSEAEEDVVVPLLGGSQPFVTDEDDDEDWFMPVRTQSGYLTIVDTGLDKNGDPFDWREFIPSTDVDRPILVTNSSADVVWAGFMQAQNFSGVLFEKPQERKFPIQCYLSTLSRVNILPNAFGTSNLQSFATLLYLIISQIPNELFNTIYIQGGNDAITWLTRKFDWMVFGGTMDDNGNLESRYTALEALTNMCTYWGWTARMNGLDLYLLSPDDDTEQDIAIIGIYELYQLASGKTSVDVEIVHPQELPIADEFAGTDNTDAQMRGPNTASVTANVGDIDNKMLYCYPDFISEQMYNEGFEPTQYSNLSYTPGWNEYACDTFIGHSQFLRKMFRLMKWEHSSLGEYKILPVIHFGEWNDRIEVIYKTTKSHVYGPGYFTLKGELYLHGERISRAQEGKPEVGEAWMYMSLGIGLTPASCVWYNAGLLIGDPWGTEEVYNRVYLGGNSDIMWCSNINPIFMIAIGRIYIRTPKKGLIFLRFYGSDMNEEDCKLINGFDLAGFSLEYTLQDDPFRYIDPVRHDSREYTAKNDNVLQDKWSTDCIFSTENYMKFGPGPVLNPDTGYFAGWNYTEHREAQPEHGTGDTYPEQHLVDRVASFWSRARRKIDCELIYNPAKVISPLTPIRVDGTKLHPLSISRDWREDVVSITAIELNDTEPETENETENE